MYHLKLVFIHYFIDEHTHKTWHARGCDSVISSL